MASNLIKEKFGSLLTAYAEAERKTEVTRQVLVERREFDAYAAFRRMTTEYLGGISLIELTNFLVDLDVQASPEEIDLLFIHLDFDGDGVLSWPEFLDTILSREHHNNYQYGILTNFTMELEQSLARVFEQELENENALEKLRRAVWDTGDLKEGALFDHLDRDTKGWLSLQDFHDFLQAFSADGLNFQTAERCFRRIDEDNDDRVLFDEFLRAIRPMYTYRQMEHYIPDPKEMSPVRIYQKTHEPAPLRRRPKADKLKKKTLPSKAKTARDQDWEETKHLPSKKGTTTLNQTKTSYDQIGEMGKPHAPVKTTERGELDPRRHMPAGYQNMYGGNFQGSYADYGHTHGQSMMGNQGMYGGMMGGQFGGHPGMYGQSMVGQQYGGHPGMYGSMYGGQFAGMGPQFGNESSYRSHAGNRGEKSAVHEELLRSRLQTSPDRDRSQMSKAWEMEASRGHGAQFDSYRGTPFYNTWNSSMGNSGVFQTERLRNSTMDPVSAHDKLTESSLQLNASTMRSEGGMSPIKGDGGVNANLVESVIQEDGAEGQKEADPDCQDRLVDNLKACLGDLRKLESKRKNLSMRFDFCLTEMFNQIDQGQTGYLTLNNLDNYAKQSGILMNREDWAIILDRHDRDKDGFLNFAEFTEIFAPYTPEYRKTMTNRSLLQVSTFYQYTVQTKKLLKDLLFSVVTALENFESNKFKITNGVVANSNELFDLLDANKDGYITFHEFKATLVGLGLRMSEQSGKLLFDLFDKNADEKISYGEFHAANKNSVCVDYSKE
jgi:Ca2+-binding EF-hand superfamily protein